MKIELLCKERVNTTENRVDINVVQWTLPYGQLFDIVTSLLQPLLSRRNGHKSFNSVNAAIPLIGQWPHSEIPTCTILYNVSPSINRTTQTVIFNFPLLIFNVLTQLPIVLKKVIIAQLFKSATVLL